MPKSKIANVKLLEVPVIGHCLYPIAKFFDTVTKTLKRRRNSWFMFAFYSLIAFYHFTGLVTCVIREIILAGALYTEERECTTSELGTLPATNALFASTIASKGTALKCDEHGGLYSHIAGAACEQGAASSYLTTYIFQLALNISSMVLALLAAILNKSFSNTTTLQLSQLKGYRGRCKLFTIAIGCKHLPWLLNLLHFLMIIVIGILSIFFFTGSCKMGLFASYDCKNFQHDCGYNQLKNCRFYYSQCMNEDGQTGLPHAYSNTSEFQDLVFQCQNVAVRARFSGKYDIRHVVSAGAAPANCMRCWLLHYDCLDMHINEVDQVTKAELSDATATFTSGIPMFACNDLDTICPLIGNSHSKLAKVAAHCPTDAATTFKADALTAAGTADITDPGMCPDQISGVQQFSDSDINTAPGPLIINTAQQADSVGQTSDMENGVAANLESQECTGVPDSESLPLTNVVHTYYIDTANCALTSSQSGMRTFLVLVLMMLCGSWPIVTILGGYMRERVGQEPAFMMPQPDGSNPIWTVLHHMGP